MISNCDFKHDQDTFNRRRGNFEMGQQATNTHNFWKSHKRKSPAPFNMQVEQEYSSNKTKIVGDINPPSYDDELLKRCVGKSKHRSKLFAEMLDMFYFYDHDGETPLTWHDAATKISNDFRSLLEAESQPASTRLSGATVRYDFTNIAIADLAERRDENNESLEKKEKNKREIQTLFQESEKRVRVQEIKLQDAKDSSMESEKRVRVQEIKLQDAKDSLMQLKCELEELSKEIDNDKETARQEGGEEQE
jgi:hypothetical protein